ncbi:MAG: hypothetical protein V1722_04905 [Candidatus Micrarchaeota archaeon]
MKSEGKSKVNVNLIVDDYTNRVLGVIKEKYGLKDKGEALCTFADMYGDDFVEREVREDAAKRIIESCDAHIKKYGYKGMSDKELMNLLGITKNDL